MRSLICILPLMGFLIACTEGIELDLKQTPSKIVIEGLVTDKPGYQGVKVSRSIDFYASGKTPRVTDAVVSVKDDLGQEFMFAHNPNNHADSMGIYVPQPSFTGVIGRTYTLSVRIGSDVYEGSDKLVGVIPMDSLGFQVNEFESRNPKDEGKIYEVLMYAREARDEKNYYLFKFYRNDTLTFYNSTDIYFSDDEFLAENIDGVQSPVYYALGDTARVEMYSISRIGYIYHSDMFTLMNNDAGGMFGPIRAVPRTNLTNGALGFFQVSALNSSEVKIQ